MTELIPINYNKYKYASKDVRFIQTFNSNNEYFHHVDTIGLNWLFVSGNYDVSNYHRTKVNTNQMKSLIMMERRTLENVKLVVEEYLMSFSNSHAFKMMTHWK